MALLLCGDAGTRAGIARRRIRHIRELNRQIDDLAEDIAEYLDNSETGMALREIHGTAPLAASPGRIQRHRLNRGGNRQPNKAIHTAALAQIAKPGTEGHTYYHRALQRGKTKREAIRAFKRKNSGRIYTTLQTTPKLT